MKLTTEQKFFLKKIELSGKEMSREQLEKERLELATLLLQKDNMYRAMLLEGAGIL
jgi:Phycobilisome degradation protein nblA